MKKYITALVVLLIIIAIVAKVVIKSKNKNQLQLPQNQTQSQQTNTLENPQDISSKPPDVNIDYAELAKKEIESKEKSTSTSSTMPYVSSPLTPAYRQLTGCKKTITDILNDYGIWWGDIKPKKKGEQILPTYSLSKEETTNLTALISKYARCKGVTKINPNECNSLLKKILPEKDTKNICYSNMKEYGFFAYTSKKTENYNYCKDFFKNLSKAPANIRSIFKNPEEEGFCNIAKKGIKNICSEFIKNRIIDSYNLSICKAIFPSNPSDCEQAGDKEMCYMQIAIAESNPSYCRNEECIWLVSNDEKYCKDIESQIILTYCDAYNRVSQQKHMDEQMNRLKEEEIKMQKMIKQKIKSPQTNQSDGEE